MDNDGIVWLKINVADKSVNVLTRAVVNELAVILDALEADSKITGLGLLSGKPGGFVYGADIHEFETLTSSADVAALMTLVHGLFSRLAALPVPTAAGIDGVPLAASWNWPSRATISLSPDRPKQNSVFPKLIWGSCRAMAGPDGLLPALEPDRLDMMLSGRPLQ